MTYPRAYTTAEISAYAEHYLRIEDIPKERHAAIRQQFVETLRALPPWQQAQIIESNLTNIVGSQQYVNKVSDAPPGKSVQGVYLPEGDSAKGIGVKANVVTENSLLGRNRTYDHEGGHFLDHRAGGGTNYGTSNSSFDRPFHDWLEWRKAQQKDTRVIMNPGGNAIRIQELHPTALSLPDHLARYGANPFKLDKLPAAERARVEMLMKHEVIGEMNAKFNALYSMNSRLPEPQRSNFIHAELGQRYPHVYDWYKDNIHDRSIKESARMQRAVDMYVETAKRVAEQNKTHHYDQAQLKAATRQDIIHEGIEAVERRIAKLEQQLPAAQRPSNQAPPPPPDEQHARAGRVTPKPGTITGVEWHGAIDVNNRLIIRAPVAHLSQQERATLIEDLGKRGYKAMERISSTTNQPSILIVGDDRMVGRFASEVIHGNGKVVVPDTTVNAAAVRERLISEANAARNVEPPQQQQRPVRQGHEPLQQPQGQLQGPPPGPDDLARQKEAQRQQIKPDAPLERQPPPNKPIGTIIGTVNPDLIAQEQPPPANRPDPGQAKAPDLNKPEAPKGEPKKVEGPPKAAPSEPAAAKPPSAAPPASNKPTQGTGAVNLGMAIGGYERARQARVDAEKSGDLKAIEAARHAENMALAQGATGTGLQAAELVAAGKNANTLLKGLGPLGIVIASGFAANEVADLFRKGEYKQVAKVGGSFFGGIIGGILGTPGGPPLMLAGSLIGSGLGSGMVGAAIDLAQGINTIAANTVNLGSNLLKGEWRAAGSNLLNIGQAAVTTPLKMIGSVAEGLYDTGKGLVLAGTALGSMAYNGLTAVTNRMTNGVVDVAQGGFKAISGALTGDMDKAQQGLGQVVKPVVDLARDVTQGAKTVANTVTGWGQSVAGWFGYKPATPTAVAKAPDPPPISPAMQAAFEKTMSDGKLIPDLTRPHIQTGLYTSDMDKTKGVQTGLWTSNMPQGQIKMAGVVVQDAPQKLQTGEPGIGAKPAIQTGLGIAGNTDLKTVDGFTRYGAMRGDRKEEPTATAQKLANPGVEGRTSMKGVVTVDGQLVYEPEVANLLNTEKGKARAADVPGSTLAAQDKGKGSRNAMYTPEDAAKSGHTLVTADGKVDVTKPDTPTYNSFSSDSFSMGATSATRVYSPAVVEHAGPKPDQHTRAAEHAPTHDQKKQPAAGLNA